MIVLPLNGALRQFRHCKEGQGKDEGGRARAPADYIVNAVYYRRHPSKDMHTHTCIVILGSWARVHWFAHPFTKHRVQMYSSFLA